MPISTPVYCTREEVARALDAKEVARNFAQIDREIEAGAVAIYGLTHRRFYPQTATRYMDWPNYQYARSYRLWLDGNELASITSITSGGVTIPADDRFLRRSDDLDEPPYTHIEIDQDSSSAFSAGDTHQRSVAITGVFAGCPVNEGPAGTITEALADTTGTTVVISNSAAVGVGTIIKVGSERMLVTERVMSDTGVNTANALTASEAGVSITMSTTTGAPVVGDVILIDSERMLVTDVASTTLTVKRAWDGTVLATHANPSDIYALRTLTVVRGFLGTTAATHLDDAAVVKYLPPPLVRDLNIAEALNILLQEPSGYGRESGSGEGRQEFLGRGLDALRQQVRTSYGRKARIGAV